MQQKIRALVISCALLFAACGGNVSSISPSRVEDARIYWTLVDSDVHQGVTWTINGKRFVVDYAKMVHWIGDALSQENGWTRSGLTFTFTDDPGKARIHMRTMSSASNVPDICESENAMGCVDRASSLFPHTGAEGCGLIAWEDSIIVISPEEPYLLPSDRFLNIVNHEVGHCLNIGHDGHDGGDLMARYLSDYAEKLFPTDRDIDLVRHRYTTSKP